MPTCPHCFEELPLVTDAFCSFCQEPLIEPEEPESPKAVLATDSEQESDTDANPYAAPLGASRREGPILYTELPRRCPNCDRKFAEANFRRRFKRKQRWSTTSFMLLVSIGSYFLLIGFVPGILFWPIYLLVVIPILGKAMTWPKLVKMACIKCKWKNTYVVAGTGAKRK